MEMQIQYEDEDMDMYEDAGKALTDATRKSLLERERVRNIPSEREGKR